MISDTAILEELWKGEANFVTLKRQMYQHTFTYVKYFIGKGNGFNNKERSDGGRCDGSGRSSVLQIGRGLGALAC